jgi:methylated-DNA-[protein]-cysteine S-methyltransferase
MNISCDVFRSPAGIMYLALKNGDLAGVSFEGAPPGARRGRAPKRLIEEMENYFSGALREFTHPFVLVRGTDFEKKVWLALRGVPYGETRTYKWLSERVGRPGASRAVGQALSRNPLPIVLPCHRIIESDGGLGGYSPDVDIKRRLLDMEYYYSRSS